MVYHLKQERKEESGNNQRKEGSQNPQNKLAILGPSIWCNAIFRREGGWDRLYDAFVHHH